MYKPLNHSNNKIVNLEYNVDSINTYNWYFLLGFIIYNQ